MRGVLRARDRLAARVPTGFVALGALVVAVLATHVTGAVGGNAYGGAEFAVAVASLVLVFTGAYRRRKTVGLPGWLIAGSLACSFVGGVGWTINTTVLHVSAWPSWTDVFFLGSYVCLVGAVMLIMRRRGGRNSAALVDAATITVGVGVVAYVFVIFDVAADPAGTPLSRLVGALYPLFDVFFVGLVVRLLIGAARDRGPLLVLAGAMSSQLLGDAIWSATVVAGEAAGEAAGEVQRFVDTCLIVTYLMLGWTLWHPDADQLVAADQDSDRSLGTRRVVLLGTAGLLAPITLLLRQWTGGDLHATAIAVGAITLFMLTLVRMSMLVREVQAKSQQLAAQARTDGLTGLANRRTFDFDLERAMRDAADATPGGWPVSIALFDLDRFKRFNDTFGHGEGDRLLRECAAHWSDELTARAPDGVLARYGGEEFALVLRGLDGPAALAVVRALLPRTPGGQSFSGGAATWDDTETVTALLRRADERLYAAKEAGRARVFGDDESDHVAPPLGSGPERAGAGGA